MFVAILLFVIFIACFVSLMNNGLWSNTLTLVNVITAGLLATNYFEPLAALFERQEPSFTYVWDFFAIWLLFGVAMIVLRAITDLVSQVKVRFFMPVDKAGGILMACWASWIVVCFATMTLHTAPLARNFLGGSFQVDPKDKMFFGLGPDRVWLGWVQRESRGALCRLSGAVVPFDPQGDFILRYGARRAEFEELKTFMKSSAPAAPAAPTAIPRP
jgi:hypothetical protein